ncbi:hypothetical protein ANN_11294 [Periplaneta americana]|uniref:Synaptonemal complex protein 2 Spt16M-like domain-containing protein n=1 Tax=Periplaneta americana TaxID=6978 RepID=A0ABQ8T5X9_PERAM|nr:hypothetical protein ANN_11294 [Periplaneta americana]
MEKNGACEMDRRIRNEAVLEKVGEERMILKLIKKRKRNCLGHWLRRNCPLKDALEGMVEKEKLSMDSFFDSLKLSAFAENDLRIVNTIQNGNFNIHIDTINSLRKIVEKTTLASDSAVGVDGVQSVLNCLQHICNQDKKNKRRTVLTEEKLDGIGALLEASPNKSVSHVAAQISSLKHSHVKTSVVKILSQPILKITLNEIIPVTERRNIIDSFSVILSHSSRIIRREIAHTLHHQLSLLPQLLFTCGDYNFQAYILELIFRFISVKEDRQFLCASFKDYPEIEKAFVSTSFKDFDPDINYKEFWIDFNKGSKSISISYDGSFPEDDTMKNSWEVISIPCSFVKRAMIEDRQDKAELRSLRTLILEMGNINQKDAHQFLLSARRVMIIFEQSSTMQSLVDKVLPSLFGEIFSQDTSNMRKSKINDTSSSNELRQSQRSLFRRAAKGRNAARTNVIKIQTPLEPQSSDEANSAGTTPDPGKDLKEILEAHSLETFQKTPAAPILLSPELSCISEEKSQLSEEVQKSQLSKTANHNENIGTVSYPYISENRDAEIDDRGEKKQLNKIETEHKLKGRYSESRPVAVFCNKEAEENGSKHSDDKITRNVEQISKAKPRVCVSRIHRIDNSIVQNYISSYKKVYSEQHLDSPDLRVEKENTRLKNVQGLNNVSGNNSCLDIDLRKCNSKTNKSEYTESSRRTSVPHSVSVTNETNIFSLERSKELIQNFDRQTEAPVQNETIADIKQTASSSTVLKVIPSVKEKKEVETTVSIDESLEISSAEERKKSPISINTSREKDTSKIEKRDENIDGVCETKCSISSFKETVNTEENKRLIESPVKDDILPTLEPEITKDVVINVKKSVRKCQISAQKTNMKKDSFVEKSMRKTTSKRSTKSCRKQPVQISRLEEKSAVQITGSEEKNCDKTVKNNRQCEMHSPPVMEAGITSDFESSKNKNMTANAENYQMSEENISEKLFLLVENNIQKTAPKIPRKLCDKQSAQSSHLEKKSVALKPSSKSENICNKQVLDYTIQSKSSCIKPDPRSSECQGDASVINSNEVFYTEKSDIISNNTYSEDEICSRVTDKLNKRKNTEINVKNVQLYKADIIKLSENRSQELCLDRLQRNITEIPQIRVESVVSSDHPQKCSELSYCRNLNASVATNLENGLLSTYKDNISRENSVSNKNDTGTKTSFPSKLEIEKCENKIVKNPHTVYNKGNSANANHSSLQDITVNKKITSSSSAIKIQELLSEWNSSDDENITDNVPIVQNSSHKKMNTIVTKSNLDTGTQKYQKSPLLSHLLTVGKKLLNENEVQCASAVLNTKAEFNVSNVNTTRGGSATDTRQSYKLGTDISNLSHCSDSDISYLQETRRTNTNTVSSVDISDNLSKNQSVNENIKTPSRKRRLYSASNSPEVPEIESFDDTSHDPSWSPAASKARFSKWRKRKLLSERKSSKIKAAVEKPRRRSRQTKTTEQVLALCQESEQQKDIFQINSQQQETAVSQATRFFSKPLSGRWQVRYMEKFKKRNEEEMKKEMETDTTGTKSVYSDFDADSDSASWFEPTKPKPLHSVQKPKITYEKKNRIMFPSKGRKKSCKFNKTNKMLEAKVDNFKNKKISEMVLSIKRDSFKIENVLKRDTKSKNCDFDVFRDDGNVNEDTGTQGGALSEINFLQGINSETVASDSESLPSLIIEIDEKKCGEINQVSYPILMEEPDIDMNFDSVSAFHENENTMEKEKYLSSLTEDNKKKVNINDLSKVGEIKITSKRKKEKHLSSNNVTYFPSPEVYAENIEKDAPATIIPESLKMQEFCDQASLEKNIQCGSKEFSILSCNNETERDISSVTRKKNKTLNKRKYSDKNSRKIKDNCKQAVDIEVMYEVAEDERPEINSTPSHCVRNNNDTKIASENNSNYLLSDTNLDYGSSEKTFEDDLNEFLEQFTDNVTENIDLHEQIKCNDKSKHNKTNTKVLEGTENEMGGKPKRKTRKHNTNIVSTLKNDMDCEGHCPQTSISPVKPVKKLEQLDVLRPLSLSIQSPVKRIEESNACSPLSHSMDYSSFVDDDCLSFSKNVKYDAYTSSNSSIFEGFEIQNSMEHFEDSHKRGEKPILLSQNSVYTCKEIKSASSLHVSSCLKGTRDTLCPSKKSPISVRRQDYVDLASPLHVSKEVSQSSKLLHIDTEPFKPITSLVANLSKSKSSKKNLSSNVTLEEISQDDILPSRQKSQTNVESATYLIHSDIRTNGTDIKETNGDRSLKRKLKKKNDFVKIISPSKSKTKKIQEISEINDESLVDAYDSSHVMELTEENFDFIFTTSTPWTILNTGTQKKGSLTDFTGTYTQMIEDNFKKSFKEGSKKRRLRWAGHVARMGEPRNAYRGLVGRPEGKRPLGRPRRRWEDNIKMDLREVGYDDREWINLAQDRDRWRAYVRAAMSLRVP